MKSINCDVFSDRNLTLNGQFTVHGNLYVNGNANLVACNNPVEVFGDVIINGNLYVNEMIIHGNLECKSLDGFYVEVDNNINISRAVEVEEIKSNTGNINVEDSVYVGTLIASEGSVNINEVNFGVTSISTLKAFDTITINGELRNVSNIVAGAGISVKGFIIFEETDYLNANEEYVSISVYSGGIRSKNINVN